MNREQKEIILRLLKERGERLTPVRGRIIEMMCEQHAPMSAKDILSKLRKDGRMVNKTTIYRQLDDLVSLGILEVVQFGDGVARYELKHTKEHHHHLVCVVCGKVTDVAFKEGLEKEEKRIEKEHKFKIQKHSLEFYGTCTKCQKRI